MRASRAAIVPLLLALAACAQRGGPPPGAAAAVIARGCPPERAVDGEVRLVVLGDSGYGQGFAEWGLHGQEAIASRLNNLGLEPDLVLFLGDNVYWLGSDSLYKARFDDMYDPLIRGCKVHVALGNHDIKGCRVVQEHEQWQSCLQELRTGLLADRKARYMRQGMTEQAAAAKAQADAAAASTGELAVEARGAGRENCVPGDASAYEHVGPGESCNAEAALAHAQFGFGSVERGTPPASQRQRYYSILYPLPKLSRAGAPADPPAGPTQRPLVDVIVLDSNTLNVESGVMKSASGKPREDQLQMLFLRNSLAQWLPAPGESHQIWKIAALHHPPYTPRSCACRLFGRCIGGHGDEPALAQQLAAAWEDLEPPDLVMTAHNHAYARSHPLDKDGKPVTTGKGGVRYFVSGGGGAPLYAIDSKDSRFAKALTIYHFIYLRLTARAAFFWTIDGRGQVRDSGCFEKGSNVDRPLDPQFRYDDALPSQGCAASP
jgi:hypothetical protein